MLLQYHTAAVCDCVWLSLWTSPERKLWYKWLFLFVAMEISPCLFVGVYVYVYVIIRKHPCGCVCVCRMSSQLRSVLGNALGQRVQSSVAASHHAVWARADVRATRRRETTIILRTWVRGRGGEKEQQRDGKGREKQDRLGQKDGERERAKGEESKRGIQRDNNWTTGWGTWSIPLNSTALSTFKESFTIHSKWPGADKVSNTGVYQHMAQDL